MYIELFLLDNLLMNLLILHLSAAMLSVKVRFARSALAAFLGACYAALGAGLLPILLSPWVKVLSGLLMALSLPFRGTKGYLYSIIALFLSTFIIGGTVLILALAENNPLHGGISLRTAMLGALAASLLPRLIRRILSRRIHAESLIRLEIKAYGINVKCVALIDTGCTLTEPLSGLPVIILNRKRYCELANKASIPIPILTANGNSIIFALIPDSVIINGLQANAVIAFAQAAEAIVPAELVTAEQL